MDRRVKAALLSIGCNVLLVALKLWGAKLSLSMALKADAIHSLSDVLVSALVLFGVLFSKDHARWIRIVENVIALIISFLIIGTAGGLLLRTLRYRDYALERIPIVIGLVWVCILTSYAVARYKIRVGRECDSPSLEADGYHSMMDMYSSVAVLVGLLGSLVGFKLDTLASVVVVFLIFKIGLEVMIASIQGLEKSEVFAFETTAFLRTTALGAKLSALYEKKVAGFLGGARKPTYDAARAVWRRRRAVALGGAVLALLSYVGSGLYRIQPDEVGVILRCGKLADANVPPGLHYRLPSPITKLYHVKAETVRQLEFGFRTIARRDAVREPSAYLWESRHQTGIYKKVVTEAVMLTGDKNEVDVNLTIEYRAAKGSVAGFLFNLADTESTIRAATESCVRRVIGVMRLDDVLTTGRRAIEAKVCKDLQAFLDGYHTGVDVTKVRLQDVHPPVEVVPAFRQVATAREDKVTMINRARGYHSATIPTARGGAEYIRADAEAYSAEKKLKAEGEATYFGAMAEVFLSVPEATSFIMFIQTIEEVLPQLRKVILSEDVRVRAKSGQLETYFLAGEFLKKAMPTAGGLGIEEGQ